MSILEELNNIADVLAGSDKEDKKTIEGALKQIAEYAGGGSGILVIHAATVPSDPSEDPESEAVTPKTVLDKTWQEIHDAAFAIVVNEASSGDETGSSYRRDIAVVKSVLADVDLADSSNTEYAVSVDGLVFFASSPNGYPQATLGSPGGSPQ